MREKMTMPNDAKKQTKGVVDENNNNVTTNIHQSSFPSLSLPKGGGAIRGIGEKFTANPVTGTGSLTVPIYTSPGRSGFGPQLSLSYDSGAGNGPFGFGWQLSLPSITRKTDKGLPKYQDADESDVFILSGTEDLVPVFKKHSNGNWIRNSEGNLVLDEERIDGYIVRRYRPRIEGLFSRIERWTNIQTDDIHWRSISKDNIVTLYGKTAESRIADPSNPQCVFSWFICESYDDKGNAMYYEYKQENSDGIIGQFAIHEKNRTDITRSANRYLKRIKYGNRNPYYRPGSQQVRERGNDEDRLSERNDWMFEVLFDYGEHYSEDNAGQPNFVDLSGEQRRWRHRQDAFSTYRAGFEIRTYRLCQRVLMFHHFPDELSVRDYLVRSTEFKYSESPTASFITSITQSGYVLRARDPNTGARNHNRTYLKKSLPPVEFEYTKPTISNKVEEIADIDSLENLPIGIGDSSNDNNNRNNYQWVDLDGEGLAGILTQQDGAWFYKRNLSSLPIQRSSSSSDDTAATAAAVNGGDEETRTRARGQQRSPDIIARFAPMERIATIPSQQQQQQQRRQQLMDLDGNGKLDLVVDFSNRGRSTGSSLPGYFERTSDGNWQSFLPFSSLPNIDWNDPNLRFIDLTGDGHSDILIAENEVFTWYSSLAKEGFGQSEAVIHNALDEEKGPRLVFADGTQSIYLADMSGDGLTDLVRISNGEICYWPNLGYAHFGSKVTMDNAPWFDTPDNFDQRRIRLADIDGSGVTDIIYLESQDVDYNGDGGVRLYFNHSGNRWSNAHKLTNPHFARIDNLSSVMVVDLLGNGTACLVWSSPLPVDSHRPMRYVDLMGGQKPHLLISIKNNMGAETIVHYAPSTKFYLADKLAGNPWITKLPFPVHVVERVDTYDRISRNLFVTRYAYHHGYFDGVEREFRGFGMVEQWDTEEFEVLKSANTNTNRDAGGHGSNIEPSNIDASSHAPPSLVKTWFHTGAYLEDRNRIANQFAEEYYRRSGLTEVQFREQLLPDTVPLEGLTPEEEREACRALKGCILRQEVFAQDTNSRKSKYPYIVSERNYTVELIQPRASGDVNHNNNDKKRNQHAVFIVHSRETIDYHYERNPDDPRVSHELVLDVDEFGNVLKSAAIGYGRAPNQSNASELSSLSAEDIIKQTLTLMTFTENDFTNSVQEPHAYRTPLPCETRTFKLTDLRSEREAGAPSNSSRRLSFEVVYDKVATAQLLSYEEEPSSGRLQKRLINHSRILYRDNNLTGPLPLKQLESLAIPFESYKLAFTSGLVTQIFGSRVTDPGQLDDMLSNEGKYVHLEGDSTKWWIPSGNIHYSPDLNHAASQELSFATQHFFLPHRYRDPFGYDTIVTYDRHDLLLQEIQDPLRNVITVLSTNTQGNQTIVALDYRVLQPWMVIDPNLNRSQVVFDALGMIVGTAIMGKVGESKGDSLKEFVVDLEDDTIVSYIENPLAANADGIPRAHDILKGATTRLVYDLHQYWRTRQTEHPMPNLVYTLTRETHDSDLPAGQRTKIQHSFSYSDGFGREIQKKIQAEPIRRLNTPPQPRWIGSGWTIFNNKGNPVRQYEPFFSTSHSFEFAKMIGLSSILFYDPLGRVIGTLHPNHTYEKVVFTPWHHVTWDVNDTILKTDPKSDEELADHFRRLPDAMYLLTWYEQRKDGQRGGDEQTAAQKSSEHHDTPAEAYADVLGRTFLTIADNAERGKYETRIELDIEGNQRKVMDAKGCIVMQYDYDMLGNRIRQASMEAGTRWVLANINGNAIVSWDSRDFRRRMTYDALQRPVELFVTRNNRSDLEFLAQATTYGEDKEDPEETNHRLKVWILKDGAGILSNEKYDFKGNAVIAKRRLLSDYKSQVNWRRNPQLESETFTSRTAFDALNRTSRVIAAHSSKPGTKLNIIQPVYNEANLLERIDAWLEQEREEPDRLDDSSSATQHFVKDINYNAKGQREYIEYGMEEENRVWTTYEYDDETFRLVHMQTKRKRHGRSEEELLQDLYYTYDPIGNILHIRDGAQQEFFVKGGWVEPSTDYKYDAIYRLTEVKGREYLGIRNGSPNPPEPTSYTDYPRVGLNLNDPNFLGTYHEKYTYDSVGNVEETDHDGTDPSNPGWTRSYNYNENSLIEGGRQSNRLSSTAVRGITYSYTYDAHGNTITMPHFDHRDSAMPSLHWDFNDQLRMVDLDGGGKVYYAYDGDSQRVRKVHEHNNGSIIEERIYLGNSYEIYRKNKVSRLVLERDTIYVMAENERIALVETRTEDLENRDRAPRQLIRYQYGNHLGSSCLEIDHEADIVSYEEYYVYGSTSFQALRRNTEVNPKRYRYANNERDDESGLYYQGARYYAPWLGRWISCDPAQLVDGINLYQYVNGNPVSLVDKQGTQSARRPAVPPPRHPAPPRPPARTITRGIWYIDPVLPDVESPITPHYPRPNEEAYHLRVQWASMNAPPGLDPTFASSVMMAYNYLLYDVEPNTEDLANLGSTATRGLARGIERRLVERQLQRNMQPPSGNPSTTGVAQTAGSPSPPPSVPSQPRSIPGGSGGSPGGGSPGGGSPGGGSPGGGSPPPPPSGSPVRGLLPAQAGVRPIGPMQVIRLPGNQQQVPGERIVSWRGSHNEVVSLGRERGGTRVALTLVRLGDQPSGAAPSMIAQAIRAAYGSSNPRPAQIRTNEIVEPRTVGELQRRIPISHTKIGIMLSHAVTELGGRITRWHTFPAGEGRGVRINISY
jgi:RHS repeat-associated protein